MARVASCCCGQLTVTCEGEPERRSMCHCLECQRRTGSVFGVQARYPRDAVTVRGLATEYVRSSDDGSKVTSRFCPKCGSTVYWELEVLPGFVGVAVGAFGDPRFPPPEVSVYEERKHPWVTTPKSVRHME